MNIKTKLNYNAYLEIIHKARQVARIFVLKMEVIVYSAILLLDFRGKVSDDSTESRKSRADDTHSLLEGKCAKSGCSHDLPWKKSYIFYMTTLRNNSIHNLLSVCKDLISFHRILYNR